MMLPWKFPLLLAVIRLDSVLPPGGAGAREAEHRHVDRKCLEGTAIFEPLGRMTGLHALTFIMRGKTKWNLTLQTAVVGCASIFLAYIDRDSSWPMTTIHYYCRHYYFCCYR